MNRHNPGLTIAALAATPIPARCIVQLGNSDDSIAQGTAQGVPIGVATDVAAKAGEHADAILSGIAYVQYGAQVERGERLKADGVGLAVPAGDGERSVGTALCNGVANDIGSVLINPV